MRVLVAGGTGFIGEHLCHELYGRGHDVTAMARNTDAVEFPTGVEVVSGDVTEPETFGSALEGQDAVVNLVALSPLFRPEGGAQRHFEVHRDGTRNVVRAASEAGVGRILQLSALGADPDGETAYIRAKGEAEAVVRESPLEWVIVRPSVVFGDGEEFLPAVKQLAPPYVTPLPGGGLTRFQPIWVGDLVAMLADAVTGTAPDDAGTGSDDDAGTGSDDDAGTGSDDDAGTGRGDPHTGQVYEIGGPEVLTLAEVARLAHGAADRSVHVVPLPMGLAGLGLKALDRVPVSVLEAVPGVPRMGADQYRALRFDNTTTDNDVAAFGVPESSLTTLVEYLEVDSDGS